MGTLLTAATGVEALTRAWTTILAADAADDTLSAGVRRFADNAETNLAELAHELAEGDYRPARLTEIGIPKPDGDIRVLRIPPVRDRVVERALLAVLTPIIDPHLGPGSFGYRPGLGVRDAVREVARLRDEGCGWALRTDIHDCFPSIRLPVLRRALDTVIPDTDLLAVLNLLLSREARKPRHSDPLPPRGLPQGSPLSPLLANLVLEQLDDHLRQAGFPVVRYGDDLCLPTTTSDEAWEAARVVTAGLEEIGMSAGADKTRVMSFADGFTFLGEDFGPRYPPLIEPATTTPERRTLYLGAQGSWARIDQGRIVIRRDDEELLDVPAGLVARIVCFGAVGVSSGLRNWALSGGVDLVFCSHRGRYLGNTTAGPLARAQRLRRQLALADDPDRARPLARTMIEGKLRKQAVLLCRLTRRDTTDALAPAIAAIDTYTAMLPDADTRAEIMGLEGAAARAYFQAWPTLLPPEAGFTGRNRRPPTDLVNSALSFGYALLVAEATTALAAAGLEPAIGVLHADDDNRPSLALDLAEEFRPYVIDQIVLDMIRRQRLTADHARHDTTRTGVLLTRAGREILIDTFERRMLQHTSGALPEYPGTIRRLLHRQAQRLAALIEGTQPHYTGLAWR